MIKPDILLLDINMPVMNGLEVLQKIRDMKSELKILLLTVHNEVEYLLKAVDIGANGYLLKDSESSDLKAIISVVNGEDYIQPVLIPILMKMIDRSKDTEKLEKLTNREIQVLKLLSIGKLNRQIAEELEISERTVKIMSLIYLRRLMLGIGHRQRYLLFAII